MKKVNKSNKGRKPVKDKKERVLLFVEQSKIKALGGKEEVKGAAYEGIDNKISKTKNK